MIDHVLVSWDGYKEVKASHRIFQRDGWRCAVPGCSSMSNLHAHHIVPRSSGGSDEDHNLVTLCAFHHLRGVHAGRILVKGHAPDRLRFALGLRPDVPPLVIARRAIAW